MAKKLTAAQRTLVRPRIDTREQIGPSPIVSPLTHVWRARAGCPEAIHFFHTIPGPSLCGEYKLAYRAPRETFGGYGTCAACRAEASKLRAVVR